MLRWGLRIVIGVFALFGFLIAASALWLWLSARPVLEEARASYLTLPSTAHCTGVSNRRPPGYPAAVGEIESLHDAELAVYRAACKDAGLTDSCFYMTGAARSLGFATYRGLYLNDCELRAVSLHGNTRLRRSLELLYPDRPEAELGEQEMICVSRAMRSSHRGFCSRHPECCAAEEG